MDTENDQSHNLLEMFITFTLGGDNKIHYNGLTYAGKYKHQCLHERHNIALQ